MTWEATERTSIASELPTFRARDLTKIYQAGEVEVVALRGVDLAHLPSELMVLLGDRRAAVSRRF